jgi:hypothetical protein
LLTLKKNTMPRDEYERSVFVFLVLRWREERPAVQPI